jgi:hypothetical protein
MIDGMTTFEELGLDEAFGDFGDAGQEPRRPSPVLAAGAIVAAAVLIAVGMLWARSAPVGAPDVAPPAAIVPALASGQEAVDVVPAADLVELTVTSPSTRLLATTDYGTHYTALDEDGDVCLVTVSVGELPRETCATPSERLALTYANADDETVVMLAATSSPPPVEDGWTEKAPNLYVRQP